VFWPNATEDTDESEPDQPRLQCLQSTVQLSGVFPHRHKPLPTPSL
jgi:hypothetical protein